MAKRSKPHNDKFIGDSFFAKPVESYPVENSLALTSSFIYSHQVTGKSVQLGQFEVDVLWLYILGALIIIGVVIGAIFCCCTGDDDKGKDKMEDMSKEKDDKMMDDEKMMGEEKKEPAAMDPKPEGDDNKAAE